MDERHIPDPLARPFWKTTKPRGCKGLVREFVLKRLKEGRLTDKEIAEECSALYDGSTSVKAVQWYKFQFRKEGLLPKSTHRRRKRRYLTEFTYEIIYKLLDPPDNVEVVTSENLIKFAQRIVLAYARNLPKKVDEIVYDVRTAKYYLEQTGKFEVIDQNNYDNPFYTMDDDDEEDYSEDSDNEEYEDE